MYDDKIIMVWPNQMIKKPEIREKNQLTKLTDQFMKTQV